MRISSHLKAKVLDLVLRRTISLLKYVVLVLPLALFAQLPPIGLPGVNPAAVNVNVSTTIAVTSRITASNLIPASVDVQLLNAQGEARSVIGHLHDDGVPPDLVAGDGVYSGNAVLTEGQTGSVSIRVSAATTGFLLRVASGPVSIDVLPAGIPTAPVAPDLTQATTDPATGNQIIGNEVLVCFSDSTSIATITADASLIGGTIIGRFSGLGNCFQFGLPAGSTGATVDTAITSLQSLPEVMSAEPDGIVTSSGGVCYTCGTPAYDLLRLDNAHSVTTGTGTTIAVLDTGISFPYIGASIIPGPDELQGGIVTSDPTGHGTFVAGILSAAAPTSNIYVVRVLNGSGMGSDGTIAKGIQDAAAASVNVINLSLAGFTPSVPEQSAVAYAASRNVVLVAAAGDGQSLTPCEGLGQQISQYPGAFPFVLSVGATTAGDQRAAFSYYGSSVQIAAPGVSISSWGIPGPVEATGCGTSFAAPFVAGTAALIKSVNTTWSAAQVTAQLEQTAEPLSPDGSGLANQGFLYGRLNPAQQVNIQVTGPGSVSISSTNGRNSNPAAMPCTATSSPCQLWYLGTTQVTFTASAGYVVKWGGDCASAGSGPTAQVPVTKDITCIANFVLSKLTLHKSGTGTGTVTSSPVGLDCVTNCLSQNAPFYGSVELTAVADSGSSFAGWGGKCSGTGSTTTVSVTTSDLSCTATFSLGGTLTITTLGTGVGTVVSVPAGIDCGSTCTAPLSGSVQLTATPLQGSTFTGWGGDCSGTGSTTTVTVTTSNLSCTATFSIAGTLTIAKPGTGVGTVVSVPAGINCGSTCTAPLSGSVQLTATPLPGSTFSGWGGDCSGSIATIAIDVSGTRNCTATFNAVSVVLSPFGSQTISSAPGPYYVQVVNGIPGSIAAPADITVTILRVVTSACHPGTSPAYPPLFSSSSTVTISQGQTSTTYGFVAGRDPACNTTPTTSTFTVTNATMAPNVALNLTVVPAAQLSLAVTR